MQHKFKVLKCSMMQVRESKGTKVVIWNRPAGEVTGYSIRISYCDTALRQQFLWSENSWIQLRLADLPSQRPLWFEVLI